MSLEEILSIASHKTEQLLPTIPSVINKIDLEFVLAKGIKALKPKTLINHIADTLDKEKMIELLTIYDEFQQKKPANYKKMGLIELATIIAAIYGYSEEEDEEKPSLLNVLDIEYSNLKTSLQKNQQALTLTTAVIEKLVQLKKERDQAAKEGRDWTGPKTVEELIVSESLGDASQDRTS